MPIRIGSGRFDRAGPSATNWPRSRSRNISAWRRSMPSRSAARCMSISRKVRPIRKFEASAATFLASLARRCVAITPARPRLRPRHIRLVMAPNESRRASSEASPAMTGAKSWASSTTISIGNQSERSTSKSPPRKAAVARNCSSASRFSRLSTTETRCWRTRSATRCSSASPHSASTTTWPNWSASETKSPSGSMIACCTNGALCSSKRRSRCDLPEPELPCTSRRVASNSARSIRPGSPVLVVPISIAVVMRAMNRRVGSGADLRPALLARPSLRWTQGSPAFHRQSVSARAAQGALLPEDVGDRPVVIGRERQVLDVVVLAAGIAEGRDRALGAEAIALRGVRRPKIPAACSP